MEKYLFNDGTNEIREVQSKEELDSLIQTVSDRDKVRIWVFNTSEWVTYATFAKRYIPATPVRKTVVAAEPEVKEPVVIKKKPSYSKFTKPLIAVVAAGAILLVYNFTRIKWVKTASATITVPRPENSPLINADSLIQAIELTRGKLDKVTRTNLRIRNTWPDRILLNVTAARDTSNAGLRFHSLDFTLDNATGYQLDEVTVHLKAWRNYDVVIEDTVQFKDVNYASPAHIRVDKEIKADSLTVSFSSIRAKSFNFCYSADKQSNYGNLNDRWFCR